VHVILELNLRMKIFKTKEYTIKTKTIIEQA